METLATKTGIKSILKIRDVEKNDESPYLCRMDNPFGQDQGEVVLVVQGRITVDKNDRGIRNIPCS